MNKKILFAGIIAVSFLFVSCGEETGVSSLVPKTVDQDPTLPHITVNGTKLHSEVFGNPSDPMVVFLHGGPGGDYRNALSVKELATDGYYVVFYDQRGSGLSQRHDKNSYSIQQVLDDLTAVINHYRSADTQKIFLFGHSWGAMVAAAYINTYPDRISGVVFAEAGGFTKTLLDEYGAASRKLDLFAEETNDVMYYDQFLTAGENDHEMLDYKAALQTGFSYTKGNSEGIEGPSPFWRNGAVVLNAFVAIADEDGFDFTTNLHQYPVKTLFLYGENNKSYGVNFARKEAAYFSEAQIIQINDTGHEMIWFKWDLVYPVVLSYLNSL